MVFFFGTYNYDTHESIEIEEMALCMFTVGLYNSFAFSSLKVISFMAGMEK